MIRLAILGGVALAFVALAATAFYYRGNSIAAEAEAARARADLVVAASANAEAVKTIDALQEQARTDGRLIASWVDEMRKINEAVKAQDIALDELGKANAGVLRFLDDAVPADLCRLYNRC